MKKNEIRIATVNVGLLAVFAFLLGLLTFISFLCAFAVDEGTAGHNFVVFLAAKLFLVLRFPIHILFWGVIQNTSPLFLGGLFINVLFNAFLLERLIYLIKKKNRP